MEDLLTQFGFTNLEIESFLSNAQNVKFRKKDLLLEENQVCRHLYFVKEGVIRSYVTDNEKREFTKSFFYAQKQDFATCFISFMSQKPSNLFLEAVIDTEALAWHYSYIHEKLNSDFRFFRFFRHCTDLLYLRFEQKDISMLRSTPEERYLTFKDEHPELISAVPLHYIATYLGITPETLSRIRKRVEAKK
jgi:CRP-like cAMP-binding protein